MLDKREELRLEHFTEIIEESKKEGKMPRFGAYDIEWLADKLKEVNNELKELKTSLEKHSKDDSKIFGESSA